MEKNKVLIRTELVQSNTTVYPDGYCGVVFFNQGQDTAVLMNTILIKPRDSHEFNFLPNEEIDTNMSVSFLGLNADKQVVVTKIYKR